MLPKKRRIARQAFTEILTRGKRYNSPNLLLYVAESSPKEPSRFSFSVSKKVHKLAVDRNKYRRRGYSVVSQHVANARPGYLCFFVFKKGSGSIKFETLQKEVLDLLHTSGVIV